ncbi:MAG: amino acid permease [Rhodospirillales bacterium]|nr:amino acid permease [Rhodospirillales bacterium]
MDVSRLMVRKPVDQLIHSKEEGADGVTMHRLLGPWHLTALGVGAIIGAGIFVITGTAAAQYAGPGIMLSFLLGAIACGFVGLCYAEFASLIPVSGSAYTYAYATLGEFVAWIIGWDLILEYAMVSSTVAVGWSGYFVSLLGNMGITLPAQMTAAPGTAVTLADGSQVAAWFNLPAFAIVAVISALLILGVRESARFNNIIVALKVAVILVFLVAGVGYVSTANWVPFVPENAGAFGEFGWSGILRGAAVVFFAYIGFDAVSTAAQEARHPQRDMPIGILGSLVICSLLYVAVAAVLLGIVPYPQLNVADPIARGIDVIGMPWLAIIVKIGALMGLTSVILVFLYGQSRIFFRMSEDGLLPPALRVLHPRTRTPYLGHVVIGALVAVVAGLVPISILGELVSIGTLFAFIIVCAAILYLRRTRPDLPRPFRCPAVPLVPILGIACCLFLMIGLPLDTWLRLIAWLAVGLVIYFGYGMSRSVLAPQPRPGPAE